MHKTIELLCEHECTVKSILQSYGFSRRQISSFHHQKAIARNNETCGLSTICAPHDQITIHFTDPNDEALYIFLTHDFETLYEDHVLIIVNKPAGLSCHASHEHPDDNMGSIIQAERSLDTLFPIGRLDKEVSGIMVYAKDKKTAALLSKQKNRGTYVKIYQALAKGTFRKSSDTLNYSLSLKNRKSVIDPAGKPCITKYTVLKQYPSFALTEVSIPTGRKHQIRAGMAMIHHPLVGDSLYGKEDHSLHRTALHCAHISFLHPLTNQPISLNCPLPEDMQKRASL